MPLGQAAILEYGHEFTIYEQHHGPHWEKGGGGNPTNLARPRLLYGVAALRANEEHLPGGL
jgi:hypothetical protein